MTVQVYLHIREIEFFGQIFQLLRGGVVAELQARPLQNILPVLARHGYIETVMAEDLAAAYIFLRHTEHRLQEFNDQQTHDLPTATRDRLRLAVGMGYEDWGTFEEQLRAHRGKRTHKLRPDGTPLEGATRRRRARPAVHTDMGWPLAPTPMSAIGRVPDQTASDENRPFGSLDRQAEDAPVGEADDQLVAEPDKAGYVVLELVGHLGLAVGPFTPASGQLL